MPDSPKSEPLVGRIDAGSNARIVVVGELHGDLHTGPPAPSSPDELNRSATIKRIRHDWIEGVLNQSLYREARLELGLEAKDDAVASPLGAILQVPDRAPIAIDPGSPMTEVFDRLGQAILILGAPGTGKTTTLLELAKGLLERAEGDASHPIPAVFNLSTWALKRMPLRKWLASELNTRTGVPKKLAHRWVEDGKVLPLLDGLDEMDSAHRVACVEAINEFRGEDGLLPIAVCSRAADYEAIGAKLHLLHAVVVRPLSPSQVEEYLSKGGDSFSGMRKAVTDSPSFAELLQTPLMLWVAILANRSSPIQVAQDESLERQTRQLFQSFVEAMFRRGTPNAPYGKDETLRSLSWLASALDRTKQTVFYVENLGLDWLGEHEQRLRAKAGIIAVCGLAMAPIVWLGLSGGLLGEGHGWTWWGLELLLVFAVVFGLVGGPLSTFVQLPSAEKFRFRLAGMRQRIPKAVKSGAIGGTVLGVVVGLFFGALYGSMGGARAGLVGGLIFGVGFGVIFGFLYGMFTLFTTEAVDERRKVNQGTLNSVRNVLAVLFVAGLSLGLAFGLVLEYALELDDGLVGGVVLGALLGLVGGLIGGGLYAIRHVVLRLIFWINGSLPLGYVAFLDYAVGKLFLRKVGGGYIFVHRMLLEYMAEPEPAKTVSPLGAIKPPRRVYKLAALGTVVCLLVATIWYFSGDMNSLGPTAVSSHISAVEVLQSAIKKTKSGSSETSQAVENALAQPGTTPLDRTKHIIVVMLEGSSFDRTLGALKSINPNVEGLTGSEANPDEAGNEVSVKPLARSHGKLKPNPMSTFAAADAQIFGGAAPGPGRTANMRGFVKSFQTKRQSPEHARNAMYYFDPEHVPVLATLALEFAVCDHWFSSVPGPSAPNHAFADYGTSFGRVGNNMLLTGQPLGSIYERLLQNGRSAKIYQYGPRTFYVALFILSKKEPALFGTFEHFLTDVHTDRLPDYSFVEPDYADHSDDEGNSTSDDQGNTRLSATEAFVAQVYDAIHENRSVWESSILVFVFASHDGFYDHIIPPPVTVPDGFVASGDDTRTGTAFAFDRLGVRVPAIIISPYILRGTVDHTQYDHSSIPASVAKLFLPNYNYYEKRSIRERNANTFLEILQLEKPRSQKDTVAFDLPN